MTTQARPPDSRLGGRVGLRMLSRFALVEGDNELQIPRGLQRVLAFLAFHPLGVTRDYAAGVLWPDASEERAHACLRAALSRLSRSSKIVCSAGPGLSLQPAVRIDLVHARALAMRLSAGPMELTPDELADALGLLSAELLPGWYDDWLLMEAEDWRQLRLHALERAAARLAAAQRFGEAIAVATAAIRVDPLRESARAAAIRIHLLEGNPSEALREFQRYRKQLDEHLGLRPTEALARLALGPTTDPERHAPVTSRSRAPSKLPDETCDGDGRRRVPAEPAGRRHHSRAG